MTKMSNYTFESQCCYNGPDIHLLLVFFISIIIIIISSRIVSFVHLCLGCVCVCVCVYYKTYLRRSIFKCAHRGFPINPRFMVMVRVGEKKGKKGAFSFPK